MPINIPRPPSIGKAGHSGSQELAGHSALRRAVKNLTIF
jgi:hypothetical protein